MYFELMLDFSNIFKIIFDKTYAPRGFLIDLSIDGANVLHIEHSYTLLFIRLLLLIIIYRLIRGGIDYVKN